MMKCIIFDKDGTLLDFESFWIPAAEKAVNGISAPYALSDEIKTAMLRAIGVGEDGKCDILGSLCYGTYGDIAEDIIRVLTEAGVSFDADKIREVTPKAFCAAADAGVLRPTSEGLRTTLENLRKGGAKLFVVTADNDEMAKYCLDALGITDLFEEILTDDGVHPGKPDPYYIGYLEEKYGFDRSEMCMVGDTLADMQFARSGQITAYGVGVTAGNRKILSDEYAAGTAENVSALFD